jgi:2-methylaconitate isomerase
VTGKLLPTGNVVDKIDLGEDGCFELSIVDATSPVVYLEARALGLTGSESPDDIEARPAVMDLLEQLRRRAGVLIGLAREPGQIGLQTPRIAVVAAPIRFNSLAGQHHDANDFDIATRMMSMQRAHRAVPGTGGLNLGVASQVPGSIPNRVSRPANAAGEIRVANPSGLVSVGAVVRRSKGQWTADRAILFRTARRLMQGEVAVPSEAIS